MSYETYTTRAIVCGSHDRGDHDRTLRLFTADAGMVFASARGLRSNDSKLRYALQDLSHSTVSLVHGKREWRLTGAASIENFYFDAKTREARVALVSYLRSVRRMVQGSEDGAVFEQVLDTLGTLVRKDASTLVDIAVLRLLNSLGYVRAHDGIAALLEAKTLEEAHTVPLERVDEVHISQIIKESVKMSHL